MSLINQMLADLEKRRAHPGEKNNLLTQARPLPQAGSNARWWGGGLAALLLATAAAAWLSPQLRQQTMPLAQPLAEIPGQARQAAPQQNPPPSEPLQNADRMPGDDGLIFAAADAPGVSAGGEENAALPQPASRLSLEIGNLPPHPAPREAEMRQAPEPQPAQIEKNVRQPTPQQRADNEFNNAVALLRQGRAAEAEAAFQAALRHYPAHDAARQALVSLLLETGRNGEAAHLLQEALRNNPAHTGFAMALARIQIELNDAGGALETLRGALPHAENRADYRAFLAALLQREARHQEAIEHYRAALRIMPQSGVWLAGLGISLHAENRIAEAREAFQRARASNALSPELLAFVEQQLKQLR